jgi:diaminohydroxyphosphoribosylaminopyrimidine deaminase/5-amino-6-(5-phosphoribosylamino)uracil reductase
MPTDRDYMRMVFSLALKGSGETSPNPAVGALVVNRGKIVGKGYHRRSGEKHAEIVALEEAGKQASGATLYLNLEPCCHFGKTPPCCKEIIKAGLKRIVCAMSDPNPLINGKGFRNLRRAGITVEEGLLHSEAERLNEVFMKYSKTGMPFVLAKAAMSLDGKISSSGGDSKWISSENTRAFIHNRIRFIMDAVMVGINTVLMDDPLLTVRGTGRRVKKINRVVLDSALKMPLGSKLMQSLSEGDVFLYTSDEGASEKSKRALEQKGANVVIVGDEGGRLRISEVIEDLGKRGITSILIEGGGRIIASAFEAKVVDKIYFFMAPTIIHGKDATSTVLGFIDRNLKDSVSLDHVQPLYLGRDMMIQAYPHYPS